MQSDQNARKGAPMAARASAAVCAPTWFWSTETHA
jgi:hypothetical protein